MNYKKIIDIKINELCDRKKCLEKNYDDLLKVFVSKGRELENHDSCTRILNVSHLEIEKIKNQINLLLEIKDRAQ
jgi:hypothetical protein